MGGGVGYGRQIVRLGGRAFVVCAGLLIAPIVIGGYVGLAALVMLPLLGLRWVFPRRADAWQVHCRAVLR